MIISTYRGHKIEYTKNHWLYSDTKNPVSSNKDRDCKKCDLPNTKNDHDPCIKNLKYTMNACCGHGKWSEAYIQFSNGLCIRGIFAMIVSKLLK
jgi:hypothetical protein